MAMLNRDDGYSIFTAFGVTGVFDCADCTLYSPCYRLVGKQMGGWNKTVIECAQEVLGVHFTYI